MTIWCNRIITIVSRKKRNLKTNRLYKIFGHRFILWYGKILRDCNKNNKQFYKLHMPNQKNRLNCGISEIWRCCWHLFVNQDDKKISYNFQAMAMKWLGNVKISCIQNFKSNFVKIFLYCQLNKNGFEIPYWIEKKSSHLIISIEVNGSILHGWHGFESWNEILWKYSWRIMPENRRFIKSHIKNVYSREMTNDIHFDGLINVDCMGSDLHACIHNIDNKHSPIEIRFRNTKNGIKCKIGKFVYNIKSIWWNCKILSNFSKALTNGKSFWLFS